MHTRTILDRYEDRGRLFRLKTNHPPTRNSNAEITCKYDCRGSLVQRLMPNWIVLVTRVIQLYSPRGNEQTRTRLGKWLGSNSIIFVFCFYLSARNTLVLLSSTPSTCTFVEDKTRGLLFLVAVFKTSSLLYFS